ncbi:MAG: EamA family transporter [Halodesulfurarchaeum sp.]
MRYIVWSIIALVSYSFVSPLVSFVTEEIPSQVAVAITNSMLVVMALGVIVYTETPVVTYLTHPRSPYLYVAGVFLGIGIIAFYRALALGPVSSVVPIYGMFIVTSSIIGFLFLEESFTLQKGVGIAFGIVAIYLVSTG